MWGGNKLRPAEISEFKLSYFTCNNDNNDNTDMRVGVYVPTEKYEK